MKKLLSIVLTLVLMLTCTMNVFAAGSTVTPSATIIQDNFKIETLENSKEHQKIKITNSKTGEVEYTESFLKNGKYEYFSTTNKGKNQIENVNGTTKVTNLDTKEIKIYTEPVVTSNTVVKNNSVMVPQIGGWDGIGSRWYSSTGIVSNQVSLMVGIVASACFSPVTGVITSVVIYAINYFLPTVYWYQDHFVDSYDETHFRDDTSFFANQDYTNFKGTSTFAYYT